MSQHRSKHLMETFTLEVLFVCKSVLRGNTKMIYSRVGEKHFLEKAFVRRAEIYSGPTASLSERTRRGQICGDRVHSVKYLTCRIIFQLLFITFQEVNWRRPLTWWPRRWPTTPSVPPGRHPTAPSRSIASLTWLWPEDPPRRWDTASPSSCYLPSASVSAAAFQNQQLKAEEELMFTSLRRGTTRIISYSWWFCWCISEWKLKSTKTKKETWFTHKELVGGHFYCSRCKWSKNKDNWSVSQNFIRGICPLLPGSETLCLPAVSVGWDSEYQIASCLLINSFWLPLDLT